MPLDLGPTFESSVASLAAIDVSSYDLGSMTIDLINPDPTQPTTVRFTQHYAIDTTALKALIQEQTGG